MKKRLLLFTDGFPWIDGEKAFLYTELAVLSDIFDIEIVANVKSEYCDKGIAVELPANIIAYKHLVEDIGRRAQVKCIPYMLLTTAFWKEIFDIVLSGNLHIHIQEMTIYLTRTVLFWKWMKQNLDLDSYDIFYTYWNSYATLALAMHRHRLKRMKLVTRTHGYDLYNERTVTGRQFFKKYVDNKLDMIAFIAETGRNYYLSHYSNGNSIEKYILSPIGVTQANRLPQKSEKNIVMVSCSNVSSLKRVDLIAEALSLIDGISIHWIHFGDGDELDRVDKICSEKLSIKDNITVDFKGRVDNSDIRIFYENNYVDCFITTSSSEGSPVSIQEALAYGIPVIGTDVGEVARLVEGNGYILNTNPTIEEIADAIKSISRCSVKEIAAMRENALKKWGKYYNADDNSKKFAEILNSEYEIKF